MSDFLAHPRLQSDLVNEVLQAGVKLRVLEVSVNEQMVGWLVDVQNSWSFEYSPAWKANPDAFSLAPGLSMSHRIHRDGASVRPVQWYFDNLLPEEALLRVLAASEKLEHTDAFGILQRFGGESAGSLVLLAPGEAPAEKGLRPLSWPELSARIAALPIVPLTAQAPKRMSLAGAQHKMVVVLQQAGPTKTLFEPLPGTASTHILKPDTPLKEYPFSAINEYFTMTLARRMGLQVPDVFFMQVPQPVYIVKRFDRVEQAGTDIVSREHIIDSCQLINESRVVKYHNANLETLQRVVDACKSKAHARVQLFRWLVFNVLVGNADNHLKNISFKVSSAGIELAPFYDLLCTTVYDTKLYAEHQAIWPQSALAVEMGDARTFSAVTWQTLLQVGQSLGLGARTVERELKQMVTRIEEQSNLAMDDALAQVDATLESLSPGEARDKVLRMRAGQAQLLRGITLLVIRDMVTQVGAGA